MSIRKYAGDYRLEYRACPGGKEYAVSVYQGPRFLLTGDIPALRRSIWMGTAAAILLIIPMLGSNTALSRRLLVVLPVGLAVLPVFLLLDAARRLRWAQGPITRQLRDKTVIRFVRAGLGLLLLLAAACAGCWVRGFEKSDWLTVSCLHLSLLPAIWIVSRRKQIAWVQVQDKEESYENKKRTVGAAGADDHDISAGGMPSGGSNSPDHAKTGNRSGSDAGSRHIEF